MQTFSGKKMIAFFSLLPLLMLSGCSGNSAPAGSDASKLQANTTSVSQLKADSVRNGLRKNKAREKFLARRGVAP